MHSPTQGELDGAWEHLVYDMGMLLFCGAWLASNPAPAPLRNAVLEAFTMHARALICFIFDQQGSGKPDVLASHFVRDVKAWRSARGKMPKALTVVRPRVGTEVAHLSYLRVGLTPEAKVWNVGDIVTELGRLWTEFEQHLTTSAEATLRHVERTQGIHSLAQQQVIDLLHGPGYPRPAQPVAPVVEFPALGAVPPTEAAGGTQTMLSKELVDALRGNGSAAVE